MNTQATTISLMWIHFVVNSVDMETHKSKSEFSCRDL